MIDTRELKEEIRKNGMTQEELANRIGIDPATLNCKMNNKRGVFTVEEAKKIAKELNIQGDRLISIFFAEKLANTQA